ncbi:uncharacterized protein LOC134661981 [Cydia amplana]|uniref:uncharacterized protein LOC134661981 n=1 Tax=Cydia amplana TaxID=1869771 RepID=UPI002FE6ADF0
MPHPAEREELGVVRLVNLDDVNSNSEFDVRIFTDGSKIGGGVGASLSIWKGETETKAHKLALSKYCTVYQAELLALCKATREAKKYAEKSFGIYSDSMAALQTVQNHSCLHPLAVEARENLKAMSLQGKVVTLHWIKAHAGLEGNERADELAKGAAAGSKRKPDYDQCPVSFVKRSIRTSTLDEWNRRYKSGETASITKLFFPDAVKAYRMTKKFTPTNLKTQLMTGHGGFSEYLNRFKCKESPSCICDIKNRLRSAQQEQHEVLPKQQQGTPEPPEPQGAPQKQTEASLHHVDHVDGRDTAPGNTSEVSLL